MSFLNKIVKSIPESCLICDNLIPHGQIFCKECSKFAIELSRKCTICSSFIPTEKEVTGCKMCNGKTLHFDEIYSPFLYTGSISQTVQTMKTSKKPLFAFIIGRSLAKKIPDHLLEVDAVIFPPMRFKERWKRGFNQSKIVAEQVATASNIPVDYKLLEKVKNTKEQKLLSYKERSQNLKDAFAIKSQSIKKNYLLIDDVSTTLATVNEISELLKKNGVEKVNVATFARSSIYFK